MSDRSRKANTLYQSLDLVKHLFPKSHLLEFKALVNFSPKFFKNRFPDYFTRAKNPFQKFEFNKQFKLSSNSTKFGRERRLATTS